MTYCDKCGAEIDEEDRFCSKCGAPTGHRPAREEWKPPREECFGGRSERDYMGLVSFGIFLLIVGYIWYTYPGITSDIRHLFARLVEEQVFDPSASLINAFALFLGLLGVSNFFIAGARVAIKQPWRRPLSDVLSGIFLVSFAYFVSLYGQDALKWQTIVLLLLLVGGILIIVYGVLRYIVESV